VGAASEPLAEARSDRRGWKIYMCPILLLATETPEADPGIRSPAASPHDGLGRNAGV